ncbi:MAG TPA: HEAT repeat domain-containing protein [Nitrospirales bacterium]|nr:HEAT repeat domain-containing protein [Nitrospirales bacterium]
MGWKEAAVDQTRESPASTRSVRGIEKVLPRMTFMRRLIAAGVVAVFFGSLCLAHADQMDDVVQTLIRASSEESLESIEDTLLKLGPAVVDSLVRLLASEDNALRMTAVRVLGRMDASTDEKLFQALRDDRWKVRVAAVSALAHHQSETVIQQLLTTLHDSHPAVRSASARGLGRIGSAEATDSLILTLQDPQRVVRKSAAKALARVGDHRATAPLIAMLQDDEAVRRESMNALAHIGQPAVQPLAAIVADGNRDSSFRQTAALVLRDIASRDSAPSVADSAAALGVGLRDGDPGLRKASADALVIIGQPASAVVRIALLQDQNPVVRAEAATILGRSGSATTWYAEAVDSLILALDDHEERVRAAVRKGLVRIHAIAFRQLIVALQNNSALRRMGASTVLGEIGHRGAIQPLETLLATEPDPAVRKSIVSALEVLHAKPVPKAPPLRRPAAR